MNALQRWLQPAIRFWLGLSRGRQIGLTAATLVLIGGVGIVAYVVVQPDYRILASGLSLEDAQAMAAKLQDKNITYRLSAGGTTIMVPAEKVQEVRLDMAAEGLPGKSD